MADASPVMSLSEARERCAGDWMALQVVSRDENGKPKHVRILAQAGTRLELREKIRMQPDVYIAFGGPVVPPGQGILY